MGSSKDQLPPYPNAARISDSQCYPQYTASLKCLEEFSSDKSKCQEHFDVYKECKKKEVSFGCFIAILFLAFRLTFLFMQLPREARLERNKSRSLFS
ncbi:CHCH-like protein [Cynara cardunculus var. scolymus]|uniref:CHCH-like protein n=1 Tax=Cynara cardunculus var. scolymus TaxID=59895 RepID=A0A103Y109_CYNCS|nr:CHCH-like protein [Cynara cardunculus var. scolymus]